MADLWRHRVAQTPAAEAFQFRGGGGRWESMTWREADARVRRIAGGLLALGVPKGARIAILCRTRIEWILIDFAIQSVGAATSTIYPSSPAADAVYILKDAGCWAVFVEDAAQLAKVAGTDTERVILVDGIAPTGVQTLLALEEAGARYLDQDPGAVDARIAEIGPEDLSTLIYTSGTTGPPKGVVLPHDCWLYQAEVITGSVGHHLRPGDVQYLFLPLSHAFGRVCELIAVHLGVPTAVDGDTEAILAGLAHTRPTIMAAVPRVFEKIHARIVSRVQQGGPRRVRIFEWASSVGDRVVRRREAGERLGLRLAAQFVIADRLVFRRLRDALGGRIRAFVSGGAPLAPEIARFFRAAGMTILEGYGMTETSAGAFANTLDDLRFGTVGRPFPGCEVKIAPDGEVWMRGRNIMRGYWNRPEATAETLDADGWLHSGDLGRLEDGRLVISGRKKDLIITSGGKNIGPQEIENQIKARCPLIAEIVMHGDRRSYCTALVWLDPETARAENPGLDLAAIAALPAVYDRVWSVVQAVNATLPPYATIKRIHLVGEELTQESGLLTPSLKVKRNVVGERFRPILDRLYAEGAKPL